jgi:transcriptional regulatory protein RtcR
MKRPLVVISILGTVLDNGYAPNRWEKWRPTVALTQQPDFVVDQLILVVSPQWERLRLRVTEDIAAVSPDTRVQAVTIDWTNPWDFEEVYGQLHTLAGALALDPEEFDVAVHITTGTHVAQICLFLLTESRHFPGRLLQGSPWTTRNPGPGVCTFIDLDLSRYDALAARFGDESRTAADVLKSGIATRNAAFNRTIEELERVVVASDAPILLTGPTGAGKTQLARRIYALKRARHRVAAEFVEVNCATLRGDGAMSTLFGHTKGAFTGAAAARTGLLRRADGGMLFLDEIGELGLDEQAMLLRAIEDGTFYPMGSDQVQTSKFALLAGTNRDLHQAVREGKFRADLLARIDLWTFRLPSLSERPEDIEPNLDYELARWAERTGERLTMNRDARAMYLAFACSDDSAWAGNFRDLNASVIRMGTLCQGGRVRVEDVKRECERLRAGWPGASRSGQSNIDDIGLRALLGDAFDALDRFDRVQLSDVVEVCRNSRTLSEAGRALFDASLKRRGSRNDADRVSKYLARHGLTLRSIQGTSPHQRPDAG